MDILLLIILLILLSSSMNDIQIINTLLTEDDFGVFDYLILRNEYNSVRQKAILNLIFGIITCICMKYNFLPLWEYKTFLFTEILAFINILIYIAIMIRIRIEYKF